MSIESQASENLRQYLQTDDKSQKILRVPEGRYKGWVPRSLYTMDIDKLYLPFLKLQSFPVGGTAIGSLTRMKVFEVVGNCLCRLPNSFSTCRCLQKVNLSFNYFQQIPAAIFQLENLVELDCSENDIEEIPPEIGQLKFLRILHIGGNLLNEIPPEMARCKRIEKLNIAGKWFPKGGLKELPKAVCALPQLKELDVSWHEIHTIPDEIGYMGNLESLNLKGNFLKYVSSKIINCTHLQILNLTGSMRLNSFIPEEIFLLSELKILDLSGNFFTEIAPEVAGLKKLKKFLMRRNALLRLPEEFFKLKHLESVDLGDNYLDAISPSVSKLRRLNYLILTNNKITSLPNEICELKRLKELSLNFNELTTIPDGIDRLTNLEELNLEHNKIRTLPLLIDKLEKLKKTGRLYLHSNFLVKPPQEICNQGVIPLFKYLQDLRVSEATHRRKMILIGAVKAGKTSLRNALVLGHSKLTAEHERTWVLERHLWEPEPDLRVQILDFGGHHIYSAAHQLFLASEAMHVLVFDLSCYKPEDYDFRIGDWIDAIVDRAPGASIMLAGTHADLCCECEIKERTAHIMEKMHADEAEKMADLRNEYKRLEAALQKMQAEDSSSSFADIDVERLQEKCLHLQRVLETRVVLPDSISVVSCTEDLTGINDLRQALQTSLKEVGERSLPSSWYKFLMAIQSRQDKILKWDETLSLFVEVMNSEGQSMISLEGSAESSLDMVLRYLHATGEIIWFADNPKLKEIIFHRPETLVEMLRAIFRHDFEEVVNFTEVLGSIANVTKRRFDMMKTEFVDKGLMTIELLDYILLNFQLSRDAKDMFIDLMLKFDLCYEVPQFPGAPATYGSSRIIRFPWFLKSDLPSDFNSHWPKITPANIIELCFQLHFPKKGPPNFFEKMSARLQSLVSGRIDWHDGILAFRNQSKLLLQRYKDSDQFVVMLNIRGSDLQEIWYLIKSCRSEMLALLHEWPFIRFDPYLLCSHCILTGEEKPFMFPGEILEIVCPQGIYHIHCPKMGESCLIPACFVYPLDSEFQDDLGNHIRAVKEFLQTIYDSVDSAGLLSDLGLSGVAAELGAEWSLVALHLGLKQAEVEQIRMDNPNQVLKQILAALIKWRERGQGDAENKFEELLSALTANDRNDLVEELRKKYLLDEPASSESPNSDPEAGVSQ